MFVILAAVILGSALMCVTTKKIMRAVTFLLFVLFGVAGIYFLLDYTYLGAAQISVYAGGMTVLYVFVIQLVSKRTLQGLQERLNGSRVVAGLAAALLGIIVTACVLCKSCLVGAAVAESGEVPMSQIGTALLGSEKYQYVLPFEFISLFLLACIVGGVMIARKEETK